MKRTDFSKESEIAGEDFGALIRKYGGKTAGLTLASKFIEAARRGYGHMDLYPIGVPRFVAIDTSLYSTAEKALKNRLPHPLEAYKKENPDADKELDDEKVILNTSLTDVVLEDENFSRLLENTLKRCRRKFRDNPIETPYHLRSSTTIEDFADDRYYGTFETTSRAEVFNKKRPGQRLPLVREILHLMRWFYSMKHHTNGDLQLSEEDSLGLVLMESVKGLHVISYSSYPEIPNSPVVHEVSQFHHGDSSPTPMALIRVHGKTVGDIEVIPASRSAYGKQSATEFIYNPHVAGPITRHQRDNPFEINGVRSPLPIGDIARLTKLVSALETRLGYSVNTESLVENNPSYGNFIHLVQLRPVPVIENFIALSKAKPSQHVLSETPFVHGVFSHTAPLVIPENRNAGRHGNLSIPEPVIIYDSWSVKGHRVFFQNEGDNALAILNTDMGRVLSHGYEVFPKFGYRNKFHFIADPNLKDLDRKTKARDYYLAGKYAGKTRTERFGRTPFPITVESDGRQGRISIDKRHLKLFRKIDNKGNTFGKKMPNKHRRIPF